MSHTVTSALIASTDEIFSPPTLPVTISDTHGDAVNKHTAVSDITNAETTISNVRSDATNTSTNAPDIHRNKLKSRESADSQNQAVSTTCTLSMSPSEYLPLLRLTQGQWSQL